MTSEKVVQYSLFGLGGGAIFGALQSVWDTPRMKSHELPTFKQQLSVVSKGSIVFGSTAAAYALGSGVSQSLRHKDDWLNAAVGGVTSGSVVGIASKSLLNGVRACACLSAAAAFASFLTEGEESPRENWIRTRPMQN